jgi:uncharacterized protein YcbK (DUF882 family)
MRKMTILAATIGTLFATSQVDARGYHHHAGGPVVSCFPPQLRAAISQLQSRIGPIQITSGYRLSRHSFHGKCMAVDFRPLYVSRGTAVAAMRSIPGVGGIGTYHGKGILHMDIRPYRISWYY